MVKSGENFYNELYSSNIKVALIMCKQMTVYKQKPTKWFLPPDIKRGNVPRENGVMVDVLKDEGKEVHISDHIIYFLIAYLK